MRAVINGLTMHYEVEGSGHPVLFIHGFPLSGDMWRSAAAYLRQEFKLIVPDLRGHGGSLFTPEATMGDYAADLAALLDHLGESEPVTIVALSMGGYVAFEFYRRYPSRVRALVLVDTRAEPDTPDAARTRAETAERVLSEGSHVVATAMAGKLFAPDAAPELKEEWRVKMAASRPEGVAAALKAMARREDSFTTLHEVEVPVLIVVGEKDVITPPDAAQRMHEAAPASRLEIIPGAGHMAPVEKPELFNPILRRFLSDVYAETRSASPAGS